MLGFTYFQLLVLVRLLLRYLMRFVVLQHSSNIFRTHSSFTISRSFNKFWSPSVPQRSLNSFAIHHHFSRYISYFGYVSQMLFFPPRHRSKSLSRGSVLEFYTIWFFSAHVHGEWHPGKHMSAKMEMVPVTFKTQSLIKVLGGVNSDSTFLASMEFQSLNCAHAFLIQLFASNRLYNVFSNCVQSHVYSKVAS